MDKTNLISRWNILLLKINVSLLRERNLLPKTALTIFHRDQIPRPKTTLTLKKNFNQFLKKA